MNPLVFMILESERDMKAQLEKQRLQEDEVKITTPAPSQTKQKKRERLSSRLRTQKNCECS